VISGAAAIGIPGAGAVNAAANAIGKRVDDAQRVADKAKAEVERIMKEQGISQGAAVDQLAGRAIAGADAALSGQAALAGLSPWMLLGGAVVLLMLMRKK
jgi:5,10-methenyltetrahydromethanopterin hydrogenase